MLDCTIIDMSIALHCIALHLKQYFRNKFGNKKLLTVIKSFKDTQIKFYFRRISRVINRKHHRGCNREFSPQTK